MKSLILENDKYQMNWVEGTVEWGTVRVPKGIEVAVQSEKVDGDIYETYTFTNVTAHDIFTSLKDIGIYTTFNDDYKDSETCMTNRCHAHIWCGEEITYVMALRMGGDAPHLGMVVTEGSIGGYSVERDFAKMSNDRGDFLLHPVPITLTPGESFQISWVLFTHNGKEDFYRQLPVYNPKYIRVSANQFTVFADEQISLEIEPAFVFHPNDVEIMRGGMAVDFSCDNGLIKVNETPVEPGEYCYQICVKGVKTHCNILVQPTMMELIKARCYYLAEKQQYHNSLSRLDGAYLIYDTEEGHIYYESKNDYNGGRERVGMGILMTKYLQQKEDVYLEESLKKYITYVERELLEKETGRVFNDYQRDDSYKRLYNYPWMSLFYLEQYTLWGKQDMLECAYRIMKSFYEQGGAHFYAIEIPLERICCELDRAGMEEEYQELLTYVRTHCDFVAETGTNYPAHEVNYEQSIVAPATNLLLQMYKVTGEKKYLEAGKKQMAVLELFNGTQPDYHMYEVALRHWDGYWFGKKRLYGDTYPHYWSDLTAHAYRECAELFGSEEYVYKAEAAYRGVLSMFRADGSAACAYVYPVTVNGVEGGYYDVYANDQDWGLYFYLRSHS